ncbi:hypothetical protein L228DRAFT_250913 [Xylona heveae TC161]|uniref:Secreted protein n=1 Tax=Xylona heveae (strain CBS 132557 / TC161) TaxID=1328760 RepID=A0A164ZP04_XYLHT|nr:hypothetical protein L228DRAFT_250913 [Xylona heveae TC161]KZF19329.1 hypothetical protein L228DRAFT_250913 [Xylona heveae TC161]
MQLSKLLICATVIALAVFLELTAAVYEATQPSTLTKYMTLRTLSRLLSFAAVYWASKSWKTWQKLGAYAVHPAIAHFVTKAYVESLMMERGSG